MANTVYSASLVMTADVSQAKAQLEGLQKSINGLLKNSHNSSPLGLTKEISQALSKVGDLKVALESAMNVNTGKLDLSKFSASLKASGTDIQGYAKTLQSLGPAGQQAFSQLAQSIMSAEVPLKQTNKLLNDFKTTLANTVKWQISSSMVNSLVGAMQHAYGYAQDLNKSLNNIRIVTGYSTDQMAKFAKEANNAAKALSTTTTQYTDASLIYYQQGLDSKAVKERTDATIKMANVTGESAKAVSDYMTAIWNNFDNGSKSLEYYADVMTALGAATASSTDEIAAGLEKFAAVSETVGLSYEYATAALATVTAETRQSADVVGNAFKTLFARIQGLNLGETQDDGTTLNKYSAALDKVGISIKDTSGEIKAMDVILNELGSKWDTLGNDTQLALAQTVAGVRQYTQLIALMDHWDTFKINLGVAIDAEGTLQEQADIYAESWQAAADRVEAAFEDIYDSVLNDEFFIKLTDFFGGLINVIGNTIDGIGGMGGAFAALGVIVSRVWGKDIGKAISSLTYDPTKVNEEGEKLRKDTNDALKQTYGSSTNPVDQARYNAYSQQADIQNSIITKQKQLEESGTRLTEIERQKAAILAQQTIDLGQQLISIEEMAQSQDRQLLRNNRRNENAYAASHGGIESSETFEYIDTVGLFREFSQKQGFEQEVYRSFSQSIEQMKNGGEFKSLTIDINKFKEAAKEAKIDISSLDSVLDQLSNAKDIKELETAMESFDQQIEDTSTDVQILWQRLTQLQVSEDQILQEYDSNMQRGETQHRQIQGRVNLKTSGEENRKEIEGFQGVKPGTIETYAALAEAVSMCEMGMTSLIGLFDVWNNQDMTTGEKLLTTLTTLGTVLSMIATSFSGANKEMLITAANSLRAAFGLEAVGAAGVVAGAGGKAAAAGLWSLIWPIGLVIAALTALVVGFQALNEINFLNSLEGQLEESKKEVEEFNTILEETTTQAEELKNTFNKYEEIQDQLQNCVEGTDEWNESLSELNEQAIKILKAFPNLWNEFTVEGEKAVKVLSNGIISIDDEIFSKYNNQINNNQFTIKRGQSRASSQVDELQYAKAILEIAKDITTDENEQSQYVSSGIYTGQEDQKLLASMLESVASEMITWNYEDFKNFATNFQSEIGFKNNSTYDIQGLINELINNQQKIVNLNQEQNNILKTNKIEEENLLLEQFGQEINDIEGELQLFNTVIKNQYQQEKNALKGDYDYLFGDQSKNNKELNANNQAIFEEFAKIIGISGKYEYDANAVRGYDENREIVVKIEQEDGSYKEQGYLASTILDTVAENRASNNSENQNKVNSILNKTNPIINSYIANDDFTSTSNRQEVFGEIAAEDINAYLATQEAKNAQIQAHQQADMYRQQGYADDSAEITSLSKDWFNAEEIIETYGTTAETLYNNIRENFANSLTGLTDYDKQILIEEAGVADFDAYLNKITEDAINTEVAVKNLQENTSQFIGQDFLSNFSNESYNIQKTISDALINAFKIGGNEGVEELANILSEVDSSQLESFLNIYENFDWTQDGAQEKFIALLKESDIKLGDNEQAFYDFAAAAAAAGASLPIEDLDTFIGQLETILGLINDLKMGDIVDQETIDQLKQWGIDTEEYFTKGLEGQYTMTKELSTGDAINKARSEVEQLNNVYNSLEGDKIGRTGLSNAQVYTDYAKSFVNTTDPFLAQQATKTLDFDGMTEEQTRAIFKMDPDAVQSIINNADLTGMQNLLSDYISFMLSGMAGEYSQDAINAAGMKAAADKGDIYALTNSEGFYDENNQISQDGIESMLAMGAKNEESQWAVDEYNKTMSDLEFIKDSDFEEYTKRASEAANQLAKNLKWINTNSIAESLGETAKEFKTMTPNTTKYNKALDDLQKGMQSVFGDKITKDFIENNKELVDQYLNGSDEQRAAATEQIVAYQEMAEGASDALSKTQQAISEANGESIKIGNIEFDSSKLGDLQAAYDSLKAGFMDPIDIVMGLQSGTIDVSQIMTALETCKVSGSQLAAIIASIGNSNLNFEDVELDIGPFPENGTPDQVAEWMEKFATAMGELELSASGEVPEEATPQMAGVSGSGGGGGSSGKSTGDSLQDTIDKRRQRRRELLHLKQEGLNPEDASKYYQEEIDLIEEENELLEEQIDMYKEQLPEAVEEFNSLVRSKGFGEFQLVLNDDGTIANLDAVLADLQARWDYAELMEDTDLQNNLDDIYNALMGPLGLQENIDENVALIAKNRKEQAQLALEDIVNRIDWRIKQIDYQIEKLNYYQEKLLIQAHGNKQTIEAMLEGFQYQEQEMLQLFEKGAALRQGIDELIAAKAQYPDYAQMFDEQILEYQQDLIDVNMDILELRAEMEELIQNVLELALDEMDIQNERIDRYVSMLDRFQNIIDLSGRSILDQSLKVELGVAKLDTLINKMSISKQTMEGLAEATKLAQEALEKRVAAGDETSVSFWENQVEMLEMELEKAQDDFLANWEEVLEAAADIFDMRVELTVQTLEQALSPFSSLSVLEDRYNKEKELQEKYLDDATKLYELNKLNRQLNQSITDENDLLAKSKLRDIQEEILAYQKAGVQMSQYDLDILQKKYDLRLAEIALMEAQNSKTSMRLIRDAAGNWTYAYDADQTAIDEALQSVEDATYSLKKASTDYIDEMTEEMIAIKQEFIEAIGGLDRNSADYMEQLLYLQQHYMKEYNVVLGEFQKGVENAGLTIHDTWYGATLDLYSFEDAQKHFSNASDLAISELMVNYKDWQKVVEQAMGVAGTSWENFSDDTGATLDSLEEHIQALCDEISKLVDVLMEYVATSIGMVEEWQAKYSKQVDSELARNEAYIESPHGGNASSGGGGSGQVEFDMRTDYNRVMLDIAKNRVGYTWDGKPITSIEEAANYRDIKLYLASEGEDILHESDGSAFTSAETAAAASKLTADIYDDAKAKYEEWLKNAGQGFNNYYSGNNTSNKVVTDSNAYKSNSGYQQDWKNPRSGWCSAWVTDIMHQSGNTDYVGGHAYQALNNNNPTLFNKNTITNNTVVGSYGGQYGHIGIYKDGYIYSTSDTGNKIQKQTVEEYEKHYGKLYQTSANASGAGILSESVYKNTNNIGTVKVSASLINKLEKYDTGGYTGTWGPYGRLALLHEKELVLNKVDTSNILDAVKISRGVDDKISDMIAFTNNSLRDLLSYIKLPKFETQPIEQTVQIQAEFPGVIDQYEIQEALSNLSNDASQYLNIQRNFW